jgi:activating signal cointegrator 1
MDLTHSHPMSYPCITLWQPWASLIALGIKKFETRSWETSYRGKIFIHAAARKVDKDAVGKISQYAEIPENSEFPLGCIVAIADLKSVRRMTLGHWTIGRSICISDQTPQELASGLWFPGRFAWQLENVQQIKPPIFVKGKQKLWNSDCVNAEYVSRGVI